MEVRTFACVRRGIEPVVDITRRVTCGATKFEAASRTVRIASCLAQRHKSAVEHPNS
jgi:hypothetical protein